MRHFRTLAILTINVHFFDSISSNDRYIAVCDSDLSMPSRRKVGKGGVGILWHIMYDKYISPLTIDDDRIVGIQIQIYPGLHMFIFQVYLPCTNHSIDYFKGCIDKLYDLWNIYSESGITLFMGDFKCSCNGNCTSSRDIMFCKFLSDTHLHAVIR